MKDYTKLKIFHSFGLLGKAIKKKKSSKLTFKDALKKEQKVNCAIGMHDTKLNLR